MGVGTAGNNTGPLPRNNPYKDLLPKTEVKPEATPVSTAPPLTAEQKDASHAELKKFLMALDTTGPGTGPAKGDFFGRTPGVSADALAQAKSEVAKAEQNWPGAASLQDLRDQKGKALGSETVVKNAARAEAAANEAEANRTAAEARKLDDGMMRRPFSMGQSCTSGRPEKRDFNLSLAGYDKAPPPPPPDPNAASTKMDNVLKAADFIETANKAMSSPDPKLRAAAIAHHLAHPREMQSAIAQLAPVANGPIGADLQKQTAEIAAKATPEALSQILEANPNIKDYPPGTAGNLVNLRMLNDPKSAPAIEKVARKALEDAKPGWGNPLDARNAKLNPDLTRLIAPLANSPNPADRQKIEGLAENAAQQSLDRNLRGKEGDDPVKAGMDAFESEMMDLAKAGVDSDVIANAASKVAERNGDTIAGQIDAGRNWFQKAKAWVSERFGEVGSAIKSFAADTAKVCAAEAYKALDESALGEQDPKFTDKSAGIMGELITNRLEMGESIGIGLAANGKVAGVALGADASMEMKRVPKLDNAGNPIPAGPNGIPPSRIEIKLQLDAQAGVGVEAEFSKSAQVGGVGAGVTASIKAEAGIKGSVQLTLSFDANNPKDMAKLQEMFGEAATAGLKATIPGIGPLLASGNAANVAKIGADHMEKMRVEVGAYAGAESAVQSKIGNDVKESGSSWTGKKETPAEKAASDQKAKEAKQKEAEDKTKTWKEKGADLAVDKGIDALKDKIPTTTAGLAAGIKGEIKYVREWNFRTGDKGEGVVTKGEARLEGNIGEAKAGGSVATDKEVMVWKDRNDRLKEVTVTDTTTKTDFLSWGRKDLMDRIDSNVLARVEKSDTLTVTQRLKNPQAMEGKNILEVRQAVVAADTAESPDLEVKRITATHKEQAEVGFKVFGTGIQLRIFHAQEQELLAAK